MGNIYKLKMESERIQILDMLRSLAVIYVVFGHAYRPSVPGGAVGVSVFFVLSGYLIASILFRDGMMSMGNVCIFIVRRVARIYPMYLLQIAAAACLLYVYSPEKFGSLISAAPNLLVFQGQPPEWYGFSVGVLWTLEVEFWFYVTFPFFLCVAVATGRVLSCMAAAILASFLFGNFEGASTFSYYDHFLIGAMALAAIRMNVVPSYLKNPYCLCLGLVIIGLAGGVPYGGDRGNVWHLQSIIAALGAGLIIISANFRGENFYSPFFSFLGRISYSIYMVHALIIDLLVFNKQWGYSVPLHLPLYCIAVICMSMITYYFVEQPIIKLVGRYAKFST